MDEKDKGMLQTDLNKLTSWAQKWKMEFNRTEQNRFYLPNELTNNKEKKKI